MTTRLGIFCEKLIEACWLAAIIIAPLFINLFDETVFEQDKGVLLRSLALLMLIAFIIRLLEGKQTGRQAGTFPRTTYQTHKSPVLSSP